MEHSVELCGVHTAGDLLFQLRRELELLGDAPSPPHITKGSRQVAPPHDEIKQNAVKEKIAAAPHIRIDGEAFALRLELANEEKILEENLRIVAMRASHRVKIEDFLSGEATIREQIQELDEQRSRSEIAAAWCGALELVQEKLARQAVVEKHRQHGLELLRHNEMVKELDEDFFKKERRWMKRYHSEVSKSQKLAEAEEREKMNASKRGVLVSDEILSRTPYLLTSFERHL